MRWVLVVATLVACGDDDGPSRDPGTVGGVCYSNGTCDATLQCVDGICRALDGGTIDDAPDAFACADDSQLEPNGTPAEAYITPVDTTLSFHLGPVAICPAGDVDVYAIQLTIGGRSVEVLVDHDAGGSELQASILNSASIAIVTAVSTATPRQIRANAPSLPTGLYYVQVFGSGTSNYRMQIEVTGP